MTFDSATLQTIAGAFELVAPPLPSPPGERLIFEALPPPSASEPLLADPVLAPLDLEIVARHAVVASMTDDTVTTEWPLPPEVMALLPAGSDDDVEAWVTHIQGQVPVKIPEVEPTVRVRWTVLRDDGSQATDGNDYILPAGGLDAPILDIVFAPPLASAPAVWPDLDSVSEAELKPAFKVRLEVRVTASTHDSGWVVVGEVDVPLVELPVPNLWVGFRHTNYDGSVFILLDGPLRLGDRFGLKDVLGQLQDILGRLRTIARFARWAVGIDLTLDAIERWPTRSHFVEGDEIDDFKDWVLSPRSWDNWFQDEWHDVLSSIVVVSLDQTIECFDKSDHKGAKLVIDPSQIAGPTVLIGSLHKATPTTLPAGAITESGNGYAGGGFGFPWENDPADWHWGDTIRSLRWV